MNTRIHECLDGDLPRTVLCGDEVARLEHLERCLDAVILRVRAQTVPDLGGRIMAEVSRHDAPLRMATIIRLAGDGIRRLWTPLSLTLRVRPAYALGVATAGLLAMSVGPFSPAGGIRGTEAPASAASMYVQFRLDAPGAARVELAGSFTQWNPSYELRESAPGVWTAAVLIEPGVHDYLFVVDGEEWVPDPSAHQVHDDFGGVNSRLFISLPQAT